MYEIIVDSLVDTVKMAPFMIIVFVAIELFEHKFESRFKPLMKKSRYFGPLIGSILGIIPQCGFSVISTVLYAEGAVSMGTLISVYMATSDEAIPIILSHPDRIKTIMPLLFSKVLFAVSAGYIIDILVLKIKGRKLITNVSPSPKKNYDSSGCCGSLCDEAEFKLSDVFMHSFVHTAKVTGYVFMVSLLLNGFIYFIGEDSLSKVFLSDTIFQPVLTSVVGLIPSCAASVAITEVFLRGGISFGSTVSGLSACAGLGLIVLFKESKNKKDVLNAVLLLLIFSILSGMILNGILPPGYMNQ